MLIFTIDEAPEANDDTYCVSGSLALDVLSNDIDNDGDFTTLNIITAPVNGSAVVNGDNTIQYTPGGSMIDDDKDSLVYQICDNASPTPFCATAKAVITYSTENDAPIANDDITVTTVNLATDIYVLQNDMDADGQLDITTLTITDSPSFGTAVVNPDGSIKYTPNTGYSGFDTLIYNICDNGCPGVPECASAQVIIQVIDVIYICQEDIKNLSVPAIPDADGYVWDLPTGAVITSGTGTNNITVDWSGVSPGQYSICVEPTNDCGPGALQCIEVVITEVVAELLPMDALCSGENSGSIDLTVSGGVPEYTFNWSNGATVEDLNNIPTGTYTVTVTDINGCIATASTTISEPLLPLSISGISSPEDPYGSLNGSVDIEVSGGTPGYAYSWSNGAGIQDISGLSGGTYTVTVTDANGCTEVAQFTVNTIGGPISISSITSTDVNCLNGSDGTIDIEVIGGVSPYTYVWSTPDGSGLIVNDEDQFTLTAGTYTVTVTDSAPTPATATASVVIIEPISAVSTSIISTDLLCNGENSGSADLNTTGGTLPYTFNWSNGAITEDISSLGAGTYSVTVTDANGCTSVNSTIISQPEPLTVNGIIAEEPVTREVMEASIFHLPEELHLILLPGQMVKPLKIFLALLQEIIL